MKVLLLTPRPQLLTGALMRAGDEYVISMAGPELWPHDIDFVISFGYRHIIKEPYLSLFKNRMINCHISLLPWNKGADPNFWSWFDRTPKGVSFHLIDPSLDGGNIIMQMEVTKWAGDTTLRSSYDFLQSCVGTIFDLEWGRFRDQRWFILPSLGPGSYHRGTDKEPWMKLLPLQWDTPVSEVEKLGDQHRNRNRNQEKNSEN